MTTLKSSLVTSFYIPEVFSVTPTSLFSMDFTQPWNFGDVTFVLEDGEIYANKATLAMSSDVFNAMFTSEFAEKNMTEIKLPQKKFDNFLELMQILHPPHSKTIDDTSVKHLFPLVHEYQIHHVIERCMTVLLNQPPSINNLILADKFSLPELRKVCIEYIKGVPYQELTVNEDFKEVDKDTLIEVLEHKLKIKEEKGMQELDQKPPSIRNLLLAEKHGLPNLYVRCMKYAKETPLTKLREEDGFDDLKATVIFEVLSHKVELQEQLKARLLNLTKGSEPDRSQNCSQWSQYGTHLYGSFSTCSNCLNHIRKKVYDTVIKT